MIAITALFKKCKKAQISGDQFSDHFLCSFQPTNILLLDKIIVIFLLILGCNYYHYFSKIETFTKGTITVEQTGPLLDVSYFSIL